jgi:hypothetical protein
MGKPQQKIHAHLAEFVRRIKQIQKDLDLDSAGYCPECGAPVLDFINNQYPEMDGTEWYDCWQCKTAFIIKKITPTEFQAEADKLDAENYPAAAGGEK